MADDKSQVNEPDFLQPLMFLEGTWHGQGKGPYGPYEFETHLERRGRWLLLTSTVFEPKADTVLYASTQVFGYDDEGLLLQYFDTAGSFKFRGAPYEKGVRFEWKYGTNWKRSDFTLSDVNEIHFHYESMEPTVSKELTTFKGVWLSGKRPTMEAEHQKAIFVSTGQGKVLNVMGETIICKVTGEDTNGAYSVVEQVSPAQGGVPLHVHQHEDEMFYILEGDYEIRCGEQTFMATKGSLAILPRGIPHEFRNIGTTPGRILETITPAGFEKYFEELNQLPTDVQTDKAQIVTIARKYGLEYLS